MIQGLGDQRAEGQGGPAHSPATSQGRVRDGANHTVCRAYDGGEGEAVVHIAHVVHHHWMDDQRYGIKQEDAAEEVHLEAVKRGERQCFHFMCLDLPPMLECRDGECGAMIWRRDSDTAGVVERLVSRNHPKSRNGLPGNAVEVLQGRGGRGSTGQKP